jgi:hypothetical protein
MHLFGIDFNPLDQRADDSTPRRQVAGLQSLAHLLTKLLELTDHQPQLVSLPIHLHHPLLFRLQL